MHSYPAARGIGSRWRSCRRSRPLPEGCRHLCDPGCWPTSWHRHAVAYNRGVDSRLQAELPDQEIIEIIRVTDAAHEGRYGAQAFSSLSMLSERRRACPSGCDRGSHPKAVSRRTRSSAGPARGKRRCTRTATRHLPRSASDIPCRQTSGFAGRRRHSVRRSIFGQAAVSSGLVADEGLGLDLYHHAGA